MIKIRNINPYALYIHCDAAMDYGPKSPGGVGIVIEFPDSVDLEPIKLEIGKYTGANIERLELEAIIKGMEEVLKLFEHQYDALKNVNAIIITTDRHSLNDNEKTSPFRIKDWRKNNWHNYEGKAIKNSDLLEKLDKTRKKLSDKTYRSVRIEFLPSKFNKAADKLSKKGKKKALTSDSIAIKSLKQGKRKFDGEEINYSFLKVKDEYEIHIYKKEPVRDQWEISAEIFKGEFLGKKLKIYTDDELVKKLHRHHKYKVRIKNVYQHHIIIYKTFNEVKKKPEENNQEVFGIIK